MFDEISQKVIQHLQWPGPSDNSFSGRPCVHRIARHISVHPKSVALRLKYLLQSGLISNIRFVIDDRFTHEEKYVFLFDQLPSITKTMINHYLAFPFVEKIMYGTIRNVDISDMAKFGHESCFAGVFLSAVNRKDFNRKLAMMKLNDDKYVNQMQILRNINLTKEYMSRLQCTIMKMLCGMNPLSLNLRNISDKIGVPLRTVRRKVDQIIEKKAIHIDVSFDSEKARDAILMSFTLGKYNMDLSGLVTQDPLLNSRFLLCRSYTSFSNLVFFAQDFSEFELILEKLTGLKCVNLLSYRSTSIVNPNFNNDLLLNLS